MAADSATTKKRSLDEVKDIPASNRAAKLRKVEDSLIAHYIYAADHKAVFGRFFVQEDLLPLEGDALGSLMFRFNTGAETPQHVVFSLFLLARRCDNVSASTKNTLESVYRGSTVKAVMAWMDMALNDIHRTLCIVGCLNYMSPGITTMITCVMQGNAYNDLKTKIYSLPVPREMYLKLSDEESDDMIAQVYFVIIYGYNNGEIRPSVFMLVTSATHTGTVLNFCRHRFSVERLYYLDAFITRPLNARSCFGYIRRVGWCKFGDIRNGVVSHKTAQIPVVHLGNFCTDLGPALEFS
uniref:Capsid triplex subunit 1 n=1 Tax=Cardioderma bat herpesvirus TaxID=3141914 RepID=A0AAU7E011_9VIRU